MSDEVVPGWIAQRTLNLYTAAGVIAVLGIFLLAGYSILLGPLVGPGVEESFGLAVAGMFLLGALVVHLVDRAYREWPLGRRVSPDAPGPVTDRALATFLKACVVAAGIASVGWIVWGLVSG